MVIRKNVLSTAMAALFASTPLMAYEAGDIMLRVGAAGVYPNAKSDELTPIAAGATVDADNAWSLGLSLSYMVTDKVGLGVLGAYPFEHDIVADGTISSLGDVASAKHLPPTVTLQYHFDAGSNLHPFVGAGINYTYFWDENTKGALTGVNLDLDDSWGFALEAGLDYEFSNSLLASAQVYYIDIDTEADLEGIGKFDVQIDPWVYFISLGKKF